HEAVDWGWDVGTASCSYSSSRMLCSVAPLSIALPAIRALAGASIAVEAVTCSKCGGFLAPASVSLTDVWLVIMASYLRLRPRRESYIHAVFIGSNMAQFHSRFRWGYRNKEQSALRVV